MRTIAIMNQKGGVGKTACSMALAEGLNAKGLKTLLVDLDQQMNATQVAGIDTTDKASVYDLLTSDVCAAEEVIVPYDHGDIMPGDRGMVTAERDMRDLMSPNTRLKEVLEALGPDAYDFVVIDCPPSLGYVATNAMVAADEIVIVVQADAASFAGVASIYELAGNVKRSPYLNPGLSIGGILLNCYNRTQKLSRSADECLPALAEMCGTRLYETRIRSTMAVRQAQAAGVSIYDYAPASNAAADFRAFIDEFLSN